MSELIALDHRLAAVVARGHLHAAGAVPGLPEPLMIDGVAPQVVAEPADAAELARVLQWADRERLGVVPVGGATALDLGFPPERADVAVLTRRLNAVVEYEPADLTVTVGAGITLAELNRGLAEHGQCLPLEAPLPERATIGGVLAINASGPLRTGYGAPRDLLIGIRFAGPDGQVARAGARVVKNVAGYELTKLVIGSLGTLGVLTEASFKIFPLPRRPLTLLLPLASASAGLALAQRLFDAHLAPLAVDLLNRAAANRLGLPPTDGWLAAVAVAGDERARDRAERDVLRIAAESGSSATDRLEGERHPALWAGVRDLGWREPAEAAVRVTVPPAQTGRLADAAGETGEAAVVARPLVGSVEVRAWTARNPGDAVSAIGRLRGEAIAAGGWAVVQRCSPAAKSLLDVWGVDGPEVAVMRRIRERFDPNRTLNPGRFAGRL